MYISGKDAICVTLVNCLKHKPTKMACCRSCDIGDHISQNMRKGFLRCQPVVCLTTHIFTTLMTGWHPTLSADCGKTVHFVCVCV